MLYRTPGAVFSTVVDKVFLNLFEVRYFHLCFSHCQRLSFSFAGCLTSRKASTLEGHIFGDWGPHSTTALTVAKRGFVPRGG